MRPWASTALHVPPTPVFGRHCFSYLHSQRPAFSAVKFLQLPLSWCKPHGLVDSSHRNYGPFPSWDNTSQTVQQLDRSWSIRREVCSAALCDGLITHRECPSPSMTLGGQDKLERFDQAGVLRTVVAAGNIRRILGITRGRGACYVWQSTGNDRPPTRRNHHKLPLSMTLLFSLPIRMSDIFWHAARRNKSGHIWRKLCL